MVINNQHNREVLSRNVFLHGSYISPLTSQTTCMQFSAVDINCWYLGYPSTNKISSNCLNFPGSSPFCMQLNEDWNKLFLKIKYNWRCFLALTEKSIFLTFLYLENVKSCICMHPISNAMTTNEVHKYNSAINN